MNLNSEIAKQLNFIVSSCRLYDEGRREEAIRIALAARVLFHETPKSRSLVRGHLGKQNILLRSTTMLAMSPAPLGLGFLGLDVSNGDFKPVLGETSRSILVPLVEWWEVEPILMLSQSTGETVTRKQIVLAAANKDGGAHVDATKPTEYQRLESGMGIRVVVRTKAGQKLGVIFRNANLATLRQLGYELLASEELTALAR
jgi:hypothetical protein